ncbi:MAG: hypothetical protein ACFNLD_08920 [Kingella oralis]
MCGFATHRLANAPQPIFRLPMAQQWFFAQRITHYANGSLKALFRIDHNAPKPFSGCLNQQNCTFYLVAEYHHQANNKWRFEFRTFDI